MVRVWVFDYLCPSPIVKLDSGKTGIEIVNGRAHV